MPGIVRVKICGVRTLDDALFAIDAGADLLGLNFVASSVRRLERSVARELVTAIRQRFGRERVELVGVVADEPIENLEALVEFVGLDGLQLHGSEPAEVVSALGAGAYKAIRIAGPEDVRVARTFPGRRILVDAKVRGQLGGTGQRFDWELLGELPRERDVLLAGGLDPDNVAAAVRSVRPFAVDVASGVESAPGIKDPAQVARFVERAKSA